MIQDKPQYKKINCNNLFHSPKKEGHTYKFLAHLFILVTVDTQRAATFYRHKNLTQHFRHLDKNTEAKSIIYNARIPT